MDTSFLHPRVTPGFLLAKPAKMSYGATRLHTLIYMLRDCEREGWEYRFFEQFSNELHQRAQELIGAGL